MLNLMNYLRSRPKMRLAFTLIELIVVIGLVVVVSGIAVYQFSKGQTKQDLRAAADDIVATWQEIQTRALAASKTPTDAIYASTRFGARPAGNLSTEAYSILIYGTGSMYNLPFMFYEDDPDHNREINSFLMMACAVPSKQILLASGYLPNGTYEIYGGSLWYQSLCWVPLPNYSPAFPPTVEVVPDSIKVGRTTQDLVDFPINNWSFTHAFDFKTCQLGDSQNLPGYTRSLILTVIPPKPTFFLNGASGCKIVQFALQPRNGGSAQIWMRFDLNTGRVSYYDTEPI